MVEKIIFILLFGLAWGSFLNVVIFRLPLGMSLLRPPSSCPHCKKKITFYDNIPVFSYLFLRGKCRTCGTQIPFSYFLVEILTPLSFLLIYHPSISFTESSLVILLHCFRSSRPFSVKEYCHLPCSPLAFFLLLTRVFVIKLFDMKWFINSFT